jgi:hypothetical protein
MGRFSVLLRRLVRPIIQLLPGDKRRRTDHGLPPGTSLVGEHLQTPSRLTACTPPIKCIPT